MPVKNEVVQLPMVKNPSGHLEKSPSGSKVQVVGFVIRSAMLRRDF